MLRSDTFQAGKHVFSTLHSGSVSGSGAGVSSDLNRYRPFFWDSVSDGQPDVVVAGMAFLEKHYCAGTHREWWKMSRDEYDDMGLAMQVARDEFLSRFDGMVIRLDEHFMRARLDDTGLDYPLYRMNRQQVERAFREAIEDADLIFRPRPRDLRKCVEAIQAERKNAARFSFSGTQQPGIAEQAELLYGNLPRVPQDLDVPSYSPGDVLDSGVEELAASTVNPDYAAQMPGYDRDEFGRMVHVMKYDNLLGGADNVIWHDNGNVEFNGEIIDNMHDYGN